MGVAFRNIQIAVESFTLLFFSAVLAYLVVSEGYLKFLAPKMAPYLILASIVFGVIGIGTLPLSEKPRYRYRTLHTLPLLIPAVLLIIPISVYMTTAWAGGYSGTGILAQDTATVSVQSSVTNTIPDAAASSPNVEAEQPNVVVSTPIPTNVVASDTPTSQPSTLTGIDSDKKTIVISNEEFYPWLIEICENLQKYQGYSVTMTGSVFKDSTLMSDKEFVPVRMAMTCCVADLVPMGIICEYDKAEDLNEGDWITATGILQIGQYNGKDEPQIVITDIQSAAPVEEYIYPY